MAEDTNIPQEAVQDAPQPIDNLGKLYSVVHEAGLFTKPINEFRQKYSEPSSIDKLYNVVNEAGYFTKSKDDFYQKYYPDLKKKDVSQPSSVGGGQSSQLPLPAQLPSGVPQTPDEVLKAGLSGNGVQPVNAPQAVEQAAQQQPLIKPVVNNGQHFLQGIGQAITQPVNPNAHGVKPAKSEAPSIEDAINNTVENNIRQRRGVYDSTLPAITKDEINKEKETVINAYKNGDLVPQKEGDRSVLKRTGTVAENFLNGLNQAYLNNQKAALLTNASKEDAIDFLNRDAKGQVKAFELGENDKVAPNGMADEAAKYVGEQANALLKGTIGAMAGAATPFTGGGSFGMFASTANEMANQGYADALAKNYYAIKQQHPELDDSDAYDQAKKSALVGAAINLGTSALLSHEVAPKIPTPTVEVNGVIDGIKQSLTHAVTSSPKVIGSFAGGSVLNDLTSKVVGNDVSTKEILDNAGEAAKNGAVMHFGMWALTEPAKIPSYIRPQIENVVASAPREEVKKVYQDAEDAGQLPQGTTDNVINTLTAFDKQKAILAPFAISEEKKAAIAGKLVQKEALKTQLKELSSHENAFPDKIQEIKQQIEGIDSDIAEMYKAKDVFSKEKDSLTGDSPKTDISSPQNSDNGEINEADAKTQAEEGQQGVLSDQAQTGNEGLKDTLGKNVKANSLPIDIYNAVDNEIISHDKIVGGSDGIEIKVNKINYDENEIPRYIEGVVTFRFKGDKFDTAKKVVIPIDESKLTSEVSVPKEEVSAPVLEETTIEKQPPSEPVQEEQPVEKKFTESEDINRIYNELKDNYGEKDGAKYYQAAIRLVNPNENTIVDIHRGGVVVKEGDRYILKPFYDTDGSSKNIKILKNGNDVTDIYGKKEEQPQVSTKSAPSEDGNTNDITTVRHLADLEAEQRQGLLSGAVFSSLEKGDKFKVGGVEYTVEGKTKPTTKSYVDKNGKTVEYKSSSIKIKGTDGKPITAEFREYENGSGSWMGRGQTRDSDRWGQLSRNIEGDISVDLLNENNPFHDKSDSFKLAQKNIDKINELTNKEQPQEEPKSETKAQIGKNVEVKHLDATYRIASLRDTDPMYKQGFRYEVTIYYPESLGENGNYSDGNLYKEVPTEQQITKDITSTINYELEQLNEKDYLSGREEKIKEALKSVKESLDGNTKEPSTSKGSDISKDDFKNHILDVVANVKDNHFTHRITVEGLNQAGIEQAVRNIREGKNTAAARKLLAAIDDMYENKYVPMNTSAGGLSDRIGIPFDEYFDATPQDLSDAFNLIKTVPEESLDKAAEIMTKEGINSQNINSPEIKNLFYEFDSDYTPDDYNAIKQKLSESVDNSENDKQGKEERNSTTVEQPKSESASPSQTTEGETTTRGTTEGKATEDAKSESDKQRTATVDTGTETGKGTGDGKQSGQSGRESVEKAGEVKEKFYKAAEKIRKGKIDDDILMSGIPFAKEVWNGAVDVFANTIELTGDAAQALSNALDHIRESDWYKGLATNEQRERAESRFKKDYEEVDVENLVSGGGGNTIGVNHASLNDLAERLGLPPIERGTILTPEQYADRGRALLNAGADPYNLDEYKGEIEDKISIARAHEEILAKKADAIKDKNSQEYKDAAKELYNYSKDVVKPLGTKFAAIGTSLQGVRNIDTDSFTSVSRQVQDNSGSDLTPKQTADIEKLTNTIKDLKTRLEQAENRFNDAADAVHNNPDTVDNAKALKDAEDKFNNLQKEHDAIKAELEKLKEQNNKPKENTPAKGKFEERKEIRKELVEKIDKRLKDKFQSVRDKLKAQRSQFNANPIPLDIVPDLVHIAKDLVAKGVIKAADIVDTIYHELKEDLGDATARDLRDAISQYGKITKPSEDPNDKAFAEAKATMRLLSAIEDANNGTPPLKSGFQRPEPSPDLRDLRKQLNDAIKKNQINAIDGEKHMKSLLDAAKKRMQNAIDDLTRAIDNNEKLPKRESGIKYDEEANKLREKRKELRSQYDKMFGTDKELTPEEKEQRRFNQLQAQLEDLQNGVVKNKSTDKITSDRIEELKAQIAKIKGDNTLKSLQAQFADKQDNKFTPQQAKDIWNYMKENYLNKGVKYVDAIKLVGNDLGLSFNQVSHAIVTPKLKPIMDAVWKNRSDLAKHRAATQRYISEQQQNPALKAFKKITNGIREAAVFGHGGVFVGTHAGMTMFDNPTRAIHTIKAFFNAYKLAYGKTATYEKMMTELKNEDNYVMAQRAGLKNNPDQINSDSEIHKPMFGRLSESGVRGFNSIKILRQALFDAHWNNLSAADKAVVGKDGISLAAKEIAREINLATGATTVKLPEVVNDVTFAGGMEAARWQKLLQNPVLAANSAYKILLNPSKATVADKVFLKVWASRVGWQLGLYAAALGVNAAIQSQKNPNNKVNFTDWKKSDWLKYKFGDKTVADVTSGMLSPIHLLAMLQQAGSSTRKERHGDTEAQAYGNTMFHYVRGKLAPGYSLMTDLATKHDFMGNTLPFYSENPDNKFSHKLTYPEYLWSKAPLPVAEAAKITYESAHDNGVDDKTFKNFWKGAGYGALSGTTGFKVYENNNHTK